MPKWYPYEELIDKVLNQIEDNIKERNFTAIKELLKSVPVENLYGFLSEESKNA
jgi:hypothetical protein